MKKLIILLVMFAVFSSCRFGYKYEQGVLPTTPVNLEDFNSEYDDYNSTAPTTGSAIPFCFSSNRNSQGGDFDVVYMPMNTVFDKSTGVLTISNEYYQGPFLDSYYSELIYGVSLINTMGNELGPYIVADHYVPKEEYDYIILYATDHDSDNFDIYYTYDSASEVYLDPRPVAFLNTDFDDLYPTLNYEHSAFYFCSDRGGAGFDIYMTPIDTVGNGITGILDNNLHGEIVKAEALSGTGDDKCPFIFENRMVFASDRPGGYGGFDLYYSIYENGQWSTPVNFGETINSSSDEYRPILFDPKINHNQDMMVFSSNRPGGAGGFDLYFVGVNHKSF